VRQESMWMRNWKIIKMGSVVEVKIFKIKRNCVYKG
jgi:hypothetical protein